MNHYEILSLPDPSTNTTPPSPTTLKRAYHRALLRFHPDKSPGASIPTTPPPSSSHKANPVTPAPPTVDQIKRAYTTLANPAARATYTAALLRRPDADPAAPATGRDDEGIETVDLEEMACDDAAAEGDRWTRGCRCGERAGYVVTEAELEGAVVEGQRVGELVVGCRGCSLWIRVVFGVE